jgi:hypothetical protein
MFFYKNRIDFEFQNQPLIHFELEVIKRRIPQKILLGIKPSLGSADEQIRTAY